MIGIPVTATPVDPRGVTTGEPVPLKAGRLTVALKAYAPAGFILREPTKTPNHTNS